MSNARESRGTKSVSKKHTQTNSAATVASGQSQGQGQLANDDEIDQDDNQDTSLNDQDQSSQSSSLMDIVDEIRDKRLQTRLHAMNAIHNGLIKTYQPERIRNVVETIMSNIFSCIKKGSIEECACGSSTLNLVLISMGTSFTSLSGTFQLFKSNLSPLISNPSKSKPIKSSLSLTLSLACLITCEEASETIDLAKYFFDLLVPLTGSINLPLPSQDQGGESLDLHSLDEALHNDGSNNNEKQSLNDEGKWIIALIDSFALLTTCLSYHKLVPIINYSMPLFFKLLFHQNPAVRESAGEVGSLLEQIWFENTDHEQDSNQNNNQNNGNNNNNKSGNEVRVWFDSKDNHNNLRSVFELLSKSFSRRDNKNERTSQKKNFREFYRSLDENIYPSESITIQKQKILFQGWVEIFQFDFIKNILKTGFAQHLEHNVLLHDMFDISLLSSLDAGELRASRSALLSAARARKIITEALRKKARANKNAHLAPNDEDFH